LLGTVALEGGESFGERGEASGVILGVAGAVVAHVLHGGSVPLVLGVLFNPKAFELMPLDEGRIGVESCILAKFVLELLSVFDDRQGGFNEEIGVEGTACLSCEDLLCLDVEEEGFDWSGGVPFFVKKEGEVFDVGRSDSAVSIIEISEDVMDGAVAKTTLSNAEQRFVGIGNSTVKGFFDDSVDDFVVGPHNEVGRVLGLDDGAVVVVEKTKAAGIVNDVVVGCGARIWWIDIRSRRGHGVFAVVHDVFKMHWFSRWRMEWTFGRPMRGASVPKLAATSAYSSFWTEAIVRWWS